MRRRRSSDSFVAFALVAAVASCQRRTPAATADGGGTVVPSPPSPPSRPLPSALDELDAVPPPPSDMSCSDMNAPQCMLSTRCVLEAPPHGVGGDYVCRPALAPCELGLAQADPHFAASCAARSGCAYREGSCVCFPQTRVMFHTRAPVPNCACGGGPPRACIVAGGG